MSVVTVIPLSVIYSSELAAVCMSCASHCEELFYAHHCEDRDHGDETRHRRVTLIPKGGKTWVSQRYVCRREQVYEGRGYEDARSEMAREEDELVRYWEVRVFTCDDGEGACYTCTSGLDAQESHWKRGLVPIVLRARMRTSAPTWIGVL